MMKRRYLFFKGLLTMFLAVLLAGNVCLAALASETEPSSGAAETSDVPDKDQTLMVGGVAVTAENQDDIFGDGKASYSPDKKTLTFKDLSLTGESAFISWKGQDLTLEGKASFDCTADKTAAIFVKDGSLTVKGDITAKAKQGDAVKVDGGNLTLDGSLTAISRTNLLEAVDINGGSQQPPETITGNGISVTGDAAIRGILRAEGTEAGIIVEGKGGISLNGDVSLAGGREGLWAYYEIKIAGGTVTTSGRNHGLWGTVITVSNDMKSVVATGDWAVYGSERLAFDTNVKILNPEGGKISDDGTNIIGPEGFYATRVELAVSEDEPETETEVTPETETEAPETETEVSPETETEAPETEGEVIPETETETPETETAASETETLAPETETQTPETETKAPETETETKAPEPETETKEPETETKAAETETEPAPAVKCDVSIQCVYGNTVVYGGSFELLSGEKTVDQWKGTGKVHVTKDLSEGTYVLRQTKAPNGCLLAAQQKITVDKKGKASYSGRTKNGIFLVENYLTKIRVLAVDEDGNPAPGAVLRIAADRNIASEWKSDQAPKEVVGLNVDTTYTLTETEAPKWCGKAAEATFKISGDGTVTYSGEKDKDGNLLLKHKKTVTYYSVFFETGGGTRIKAQQVESGKTIENPKDPERSGYSFGGWYTDTALKKAFDLKTPVTGNMTLYAKWTGGPAADESSAEPESGQASVSYDITAGAGSTFRKGSEEEVDIVIKRSTDNESSFDHLESVKIDETLLKIEDEYTVKKDQSAIALKPAVLNSLEPGMRTLTVKFDDGQVQTQIHIRAQADGNGGKDDAGGTGIKGIGKMIGGGIALVIAAAAIAAGIYFKGGKMKR